MKLKTKQWIGLLLAAVLTLSTLAGCAPSQGGSISSSRTEAQSASEAEKPQGDIPLNSQGKLTLYQSRTQTTYGSSVVETTLYLPVERTLPEGLTAHALDELIKETGIYTPYTIEKLEEKDGIALVTLSGTADPDYENRQLYDTCAMTLLQNCPVSGVSFLLDGQPAPLQAGQTDPAVFEPAQLVTPALSQQEYTALRQQISYEEVVRKEREWLETMGYDFSRPLDSWDLKGDKQAKEILDYIANVTRLNIPKEDFDSITEAPNHFIQMAAVLNTPYVFWNSQGEVNDYPLLAPMEEATWDMQGNLQEHVDLTARELFGPEVTLKHTNGEGLGPWNYHEYAGVYTPPHMGTPYPDCFLLEYSREGDTITATVAYSSYFTGFGGADEEEQKLAAQMTEEDFVTQRSPRHQFTIKALDSGLYLTGHKDLGIPQK